MSLRSSSASEGDADFEVAQDTVHCTGSWTVGRIAGLERRLDHMPWPKGTQVVFDGSAVTALDTAGAWLLRRSLRTVERSGQRVSLRGLRAEHEALFAMIGSPEVEVALATTLSTPPLLERVGAFAWHGGQQGMKMLPFVGEVAVAAARCAARPTRIRWRPTLYNVRTAGFDALPIVGLLCFLMGIVIAYQGATQLRRYGANIFVADLVGLAMLRELSPLLTAIIVAGRSGSAYAAQIGTMKVTEEIDALRTVGIAPIELLVLPKIVALTIALPLLTVYADVLGVSGGMLMARTELGVNHTVFLDRLQHALRLSDYLVGIGKAPIFAGIIAVVGCFQGFQVAGDAESVGRRTTVSVVQSIFLVILADALFSVIFNYLGI
ncbi:MAG TPA: MlaE family lipid ABC transporter permease subunit [Myxococcota bacterium]|nr:MlaE family lipid ABC transporter permease subunit [Myxococcota bacterium]